MSKFTGSSNHHRLLELLRSIRNEAGLRQADLAALVNETQSFVSKYESGERRLDILELRQICAAVGITLENFVRRLEGSLNETESKIPQTAKELLGERPKSKPAPRIHKTKHRPSKSSNS